MTKRTAWPPRKRSAIDSDVAFFLFVVFTGLLIAAASYANYIASF